MKNVRDIFHELVLRGVILDSTLVGCSEVEIASIEQHFGCKVPLAYRDFLLIAGRSAGKVFVVLIYFIRDYLG